MSDGGQSDDREYISSQIMELLTLATLITELASQNKKLCHK